jgi:hypothetical protein
MAINWDFLTTYDNVQDQYDQFIELFTTLYNLSFPLISFKANKNHYSMNPWMTKGLLVSRLHKNKLCHDSVKRPYDPLLSTYKSYRNLYFRILTASKKMYFQTQLEANQANSKKTWENN